jgi:lipoprotein-releasing system permease protein
LKVERIVTILLALIMLVAAFISCLTSDAMKDKGADRDSSAPWAPRARRSCVFFLSGASTGAHHLAWRHPAVAGSIERIGAACPHQVRRAAHGRRRLLSRLPAIVEFSQVALVAALALALSFAATLYPAWRRRA